MAQPNALILSGYGLNCEEETKTAFEKAGANARLVPINDLIDNKSILNDYQIFAFPGGFSFGDDTGSGNAMANKIKNTMWDEVRRFVEADNLVVGICNGFQILSNLGLLPAVDANYGSRNVVLKHNDNAKYTTRWVDVKFEGKGPWLKDLGTMSLPIAHGEGKFYAESDVMKILNERNCVAARYVKGDICEHLDYPANPNGALEDIAGITDESGRVLGMMPHPERAINYLQLPHWTQLKEEELRGGTPLPTEMPALRLFKNAVRYFE